MKRIIRREARPARTRRHSKSTAAEFRSAAPAGAIPTARRGRRFWVILLLLGCLVGSAIVSFTFFRSFAATTPRELVGTWQVVNGDLKGATLEFTWDGKAIATAEKNGKIEVTDSAVRVEGKKIYLTSPDDVTGKPQTFTQTIVKVTDDELIIRDADKHIYRMVRVRN